MPSHHTFAGDKGSSHVPAEKCLGRSRDFGTVQLSSCLGAVGQPRHTSAPPDAWCGTAGRALNTMAAGWTHCPTSLPADERTYLVAASH